MLLNLNFRSLAWCTGVLACGWTLGAEPAADSSAAEPSRVTAETQGGEENSEGTKEGADKSDHTSEVAGETESLTPSAAGGGGGGGSGGGTSVENAVRRERSESDDGVASSLDSGFWGGWHVGGSVGHAMPQPTGSRGSASAGASLLGVRSSQGGSGGSNNRSGFGGGRSSATSGGTLQLGGSGAGATSNTSGSGTLSLSSGASHAGAGSVYGGSLNSGTLTPVSNTVTINSGNSGTSAGGVVVTNAGAGTLSLAGGSTLLSGGVLQIGSGAQVINSGSLNLTGTSIGSERILFGGGYGLFWNSLTVSALPELSGSQMIGSTMVAGGADDSTVLPPDTDGIESVELIDLEGNAADLVMPDGLLDLNPTDPVVDSFGGNLESSDGADNTFMINATVVPEPGSLAALGAIWLLCWRRPRR